MNNSILNSLKLILYSFILLLVLNCNLNNQVQIDKDITINSLDITNSIIYKNENGDLNLLTENGNNIIFVKSDINTKHFWPTISNDNKFISYSYVIEQIVDYKIGINILDIENNKTYEIYSETNPLKNVLSNQIPHYMAWSLTENILSFVIPTENYPALYLHKTSNIKHTKKLVENGPIWISWNENNKLSVHRRNKRLIFNINNSITNLIHINEVSPFYRIDAWGLLNPMTHNIFSVYQNDAKYKHIVKDDILNNTSKFLNTSEHYPLINISPDKSYLSVLKSEFHPTVLYDSFVLYKTKDMSEIIEITNVPIGYFWAPDSNKIALFTANQNNEYYDLYILYIDNLELKKMFTFKLSPEQLEMIIFSDQFSQSHNIWSPDSSKLLISGNLVFNNVNNNSIDKNSNIILISELNSNPKSEILFNGSIAYWGN